MRNFIKQYSSSTESFDELPYSRMDGEEVFHLDESIDRLETERRTADTIVERLEAENRVLEETATECFTPLEYQLFRSSRAMAATALGLNGTPLGMQLVGIESSVPMAIKPVTAENKSALNKIKEGISVMVNKLIEYYHKFVKFIRGIFGNLSNRFKSTAKTIKNLPRTPELKTGLSEEMQKKFWKSFFGKAIRDDVKSAACVSEKGLTNYIDAINVLNKFFDAFLKNLPLSSWNTFIENEEKFVKAKESWFRDASQFKFEIGRYHLQVQMTDSGLELVENKINIPTQEFFVNLSELAVYLDKVAAPSADMVVKTIPTRIDKITNEFRNIFKKVDRAAESKNELTIFNHGLRKLLNDFLSIYRKVVSRIAGGLTALHQFVNRFVVYPS